MLLHFKLFFLFTGGSEGGEGSIGGGGLYPLLCEGIGGRERGGGKKRRESNYTLSILFVGQENHQTKQIKSKNSPQGSLKIFTLSLPVALQRKCANLNC